MEDPREDPRGRERNGERARGEDLHGGVSMAKRR